MNSETLRAVVDCLIPPDDFPGAYDAGVCDYLKRLFRTDLASQSGFFRAGIEGIEAEALARWQHSLRRPHTRAEDLNPRSNRVG